MAALIGLLLIGLALLGAPLFTVLGGAGIANFSGTETSLVVLAEEHYKLATNPHLITIPLFTLSGFLMAESQGSGPPGSGESSAAGVAARRPGHRGGRLLCVLHHVHRGLGGHHHRPGGSAVPHPQERALSGALQPRTHHVQRIDRAIVPAVAADHPVRNRRPRRASISSSSRGSSPAMLFLLVLGSYSLFVGKKHKVNRTPFDLGEALGATVGRPSGSCWCRSSSSWPSTASPG